MLTVVTPEMISVALQQLGIKPGDTVLVHSSMKSMGHVDGGPAAVIKGFEDVLGKDGTLVMPTLCQVDFINSYKTWYMDKPSDVGYLTEYFRKQIYVYRSNHPTHSVAARGKKAYQLTYEHTAFGPHLSPFGEYAFADSSPWIKMLNNNAKIVFLGVSMRFNTMKHVAEACFLEGILKQVQDSKRRAALRLKIRTFDRMNEGGVWPFSNYEPIQEELERLGLISHARCGNAEVLCVSMKEMFAASLEFMNKFPEKWCDDKTLEWIKCCR